MIFLNIFDNYWTFHADLGGMTLPSQMIPHQMRDYSRKSKHNGIACWKLIDSDIASEEIVALETVYKKTIPPSFRSFLQHKFYLDFRNVYSFSLDFFDLDPVNRLDLWKQRLEEEFRPFTDNGFLVIGTFQDDTGVLCFDANVETQDHEYPLVLIDYSFEAIEPLADDFKDFFQKLAAYTEKWKLKSEG